MEIDKDQMEIDKDQMEIDKAMRTTAIIYVAVPLHWTVKDNENEKILKCQDLRIQILKLYKSETYANHSSIIGGNFNELRETSYGNTVKS